MRYITIQEMLPEDEFELSFDGGSAVVPVLTALRAVIADGGGQRRVSTGERAHWQDCVRALDLAIASATRARGAEYGTIYLGESGA